MKKQHLVTASIGQEKYRTELRSENHFTLSDASVEEGGHDDGFAPTDLLAASLAACTAITLSMYANRKGFNLTHIDVKVTVHGEKTDNSLKTILKRELILEGDLTEEQRERLLQIANACPIHKTLTNPIEIYTALAAKTA